MRTHSFLFSNKSQITVAKASIHKGSPPLYPQPFFPTGEHSASVLESAGVVTHDRHPSLQREMPNQCISPSSSPSAKALVYHLKRIPLARSIASDRNTGREKLEALRFTTLTLAFAWTFGKCSSKGFQPARSRLVENRSSTFKGARTSTDRPLGTECVEFHQVRLRFSVPFDDPCRVSALRWHFVLFSGFRHFQGVCALSVIRCQRKQRGRRYTDFNNNLITAGWCLPEMINGSWVVAGVRLIYGQLPQRSGEGGRFSICLVLGIIA